jgi:hypothetical protein
VGRFKAGAKKLLTPASSFRCFVSTLSLLRQQLSAPATHQLAILPYNLHCSLRENHSKAHLRAARIMFHSDLIANSRNAP